jgi:hypothetical protein
MAFGGRSDPYRTSADALGRTWSLVHFSINASGMSAHA